MRKIDTEAYNKRLHTEIMELDKLIKSINPENVNKIDAGLIETADEYIRLISDTTWADNSNFNGIEMHKIRDILSKIKSSKNDVFINRDLVTCRKEGKNYFRLSHEIKCPENYDGRSSLIIPRVIYDSNGISVYNGKIEDSFDLGHKIKFVVYKQPLKVLIDFELEVSDDFDDKIHISIFYMFWK